MTKQVKVKILDMEYDKENNLFQMKIEELVGDHKKVVLAIAGSDFGITPEINIDLIKTFCIEMIGKEKNLHIQRVDSTIDTKEASLDDMWKAYDDTMGYPISEVKNYLDSEQKE